MFELVSKVVRILALAPVISRKPRKRRPTVYEALEARRMLYGYLSAQNEGPYNALNTAELSIAAPGVLSGVSGSNPPFAAHLVGQATHGTATVNADGSWYYTADAGYTGSDSFTYDATDSQSDTSNTATVTLNVTFGALSDVDQTKLPAELQRFSASLHLRHHQQPEPEQPGHSPFGRCPYLGR